MARLHVKQNYSKIISAFADVRLKLFQRVKTCLKLFQNYFAGLSLLQLMSIFQNVQCR